MSWKVFSGGDFKVDKETLTQVANTLDTLFGHTGDKKPTSDFLDTMQKVLETCGSAKSSSVDEAIDNLFKDVPERQRPHEYVNQLRYDIINQNEGNQYLIVVDLPGIKKESISINTSVIDSRKTLQIMTNVHIPYNGHIILQGRYDNGKHITNVKLPDSADIDGNIDAKFEDGLLFVTVSKSLKPKQKIEIR